MRAYSVVGTATVTAAACTTTGTAVIATGLATTAAVSGAEAPEVVVSGLTVATEAVTDDETIAADDVEAAVAVDVEEVRATSAACSAAWRISVGFVNHDT